MREVRGAAALVALLVVTVTCGPVMAQEVTGPAGDEFKKGQAELSAGHVDAASRLFGSALKKVSRPEDGAVVSAALAQAMAGQGKYEDAKAMLEAKAKTSSAYALELARLILSHEVRGAGEAAALMHDIVTKEPKNKEAWLLYGKALTRSGRRGEGIRAYEQIISHLDAKDLRAYHGQAEAYIMGNQFQKARALMQTALKIDPENAQTHLWMGRGWDRDRTRIGSYSRGIECYENALRLDRGNSMYLGHIVFDLLLMSRTNDAAKSQEARLNKNPNDTITLWYNGLKAELAGDVAGAVNSYRQAIAAHPRNIYAYFSLAHVYTGKPTPGFGAMTGPRSETWRYAPFRNPGQAASALAVIKLEDPTFPFLDALEGVISESTSGPESVTSPTEATVSRIRKLVDYYQHLQLVR